MKSMHHNPGRTYNRFAHHACISALMLLFVCLSATAFAGVNRTWTGLSGKPWFTTAQNWTGNAAPGSEDMAIFSGSGVATINGLSEDLEFNSTVGSVGSTNGISVILTASQTTGVNFTSDSTFSPTASPGKSIRFFNGPKDDATGIGVLQNNIILEEGAGSIVFDGDPTDTVPFQITMGSSASYDTFQQFLNNSAPGGSVIRFGSDVVFAVGGSRLRNIIFNGTGDIVANGRFIFGQKGCTLTKKGSGMLTLGGDSTDKTNVTVSGHITTNNLYMEDGTLNIDNNGAVGTGTFTIFGGVTIDNTSGTAVAIKTNPRIAINGDFIFAGSNDLALGSGQVDLAGPARTIAVAAGRFGLGGAINGPGIGITKTGAGTLVLSGSSTDYTGTTTVTRGAVMANGSISNSVVTVASGASFGGSGTVANVIMEAGSTLRPGDLALAVSDTYTYSGTRFPGMLNSTYALMRLDKSAAASGPALTLKPGAGLEIAIGRGVTSTRTVIYNADGATTPSVAFNNNHIKIRDLTGGVATPGYYPIFYASGTVATFDTLFTGLTANSNGVITSGLTVEAPAIYSIPSNSAYRLERGYDGIWFRLYGRPVLTCPDEVIVVPGWSFYMRFERYDSSETYVSGLPSGLNYTSIYSGTQLASTILISGTVSQTAALGTHTATITVSNPAASVSKNILVRVVDPSSVPPPVLNIDEILLSAPGVPFSYEIKADYLPQSITSGTTVLDPWVKISQNPVTGIWTVSGTAPSMGNWTIPVVATNPQGSDEKPLTIISATSTLPPVIISATNVVWAVNNSSNYQIYASNDPAYYGITGTLPAGVTFNPHNGLFSGTATALGTSTFAINAINTSGTGSALLHVQVVGDMVAPHFTSTSAKLGYLNQAYSHTFTASPYISAITPTSALPSWLSYDPRTYTISGTCPGDAASWALSGTTWSIPFEAFNSVGSDTQTFDLVIKQFYPIPTVTTPKKTMCYVGRPYVAQITVNTTAGLEGYSQVGLPPGLTFDPARGEISGTPTTSGTYTITYGATTSGGTGTKQQILTVLPVPTGPFINSPSTAIGASGQAFTYQIATETTAATYSARNLPHGLSINPATGLISGTPDVGGYYSVTIATVGPTGETFETTIVLAIAPAYSTLVTYAGGLGIADYINASGTAARFNQPSGALITLSGTIYVADLNNSAIRTIATDGMVSDHVVGVKKPASIAIDSIGNIYYADVQNNCINVVWAFDKTVWAVASGVLAPGGVAIDAADNIYFSDGGNNVIKKLSSKDGSITVFAGSGTPGAVDAKGTAASFYAPSGLVYDKARNVLYVADMLNNTIRAIDIATSAVTTIAGSAEDDEGNIDGKGSIARFRTPEGLAIDKAGFLYIADTGNSTIRVCDPKSGLVITLIGAPQQTGAVDGDGVTARMNLPSGIIVDNAGTGDIYVVDSGNNSIRTLLSAPYIVSPLVSTTIAAGSSLTIDGGAWGAPVPTYTWFKDGVKLSGTQARTLSFNPVKDADAGTYQVVASNVTGTANSAMQLTVTAGSSSGGGSSGGNGGGGGSTSLWFLLATAGLAIVRRIFGNQTRK